MNRGNLRYITIKYDLTYHIINKIFSANDDVPYINRINFNNITSDMYIYIIEFTKTMNSYFIEQLTQYKQIIKHANKNINHLNSKYEISKIRIEIFDNIQDNLNKILNTSFKIKDFLQRLLYRYNYQIIQYYLCSYMLIIKKIGDFFGKSTALYNEAVEYINLCQEDAKEILELFPVDDIDDINCDQEPNTDIQYIEHTQYIESTQYTQSSHYDYLNTESFDQETYTRFICDLSNVIFEE